MKGVAFKVTYNDGTLNQQEWFSGACSRDTIRHNIEAKRSQCLRTTEPGQCHHYYLHGGRRPKTGHCYESDVFMGAHTEYSCGNWHRGARAHQEINPADMVSRSIAFLTTRVPGDHDEGERRIFAVYRIGDGEDGVYDRSGDGHGWMVRAAPGLDLRLPRDVAVRTTFWPHYAPDKKPDWRMGLYRYLDEEATERILEHLQRLLRRSVHASTLAAIRGHRLPLAPLGPTHPGRPSSSAGHVGEPAEHVPLPRDVATPELSRRDPAEIERGLRGHAETVNACIDFLLAAQIAPRKTKSGEPHYDLAWDHAGKIYVAEVKSLTHTNEEVQLRLGLGQVLRYRHQLASLYDRAVVPVLITERQPSDSSWNSLCASLGVVLLWPEILSLAALRKSRL